MKDFFKMRFLDALVKPLARTLAPRNGRQKVNREKEVKAQSLVTRGLDVYFPRPACCFL